MTVISVVVLIIITLKYKTDGNVLHINDNILYF